MKVEKGWLEWSVMVDVYLNLKDEVTLFYIFVFVNKSHEKT